MIRKSKAATIVPRVPIPHEDWNAAVEEFRRNRPLICGSRTGGGWRHPWYPELAWDEALGFWRVTIKPGFVNGGEVEVSMRASEAPQETRDRLGDEGRIQARLSEEPAIPVREWRSIGPDAEPVGFTTNASGLSVTANYESVTPFFAALGVGSPPSRTISAASGERTEVATTDRSQERLLRACDIVLRVQRPAAAAQWKITGDPLAGSVAEFDVVYAGAVQVDANPQIIVTPDYAPDPEPDPAKRLLGEWEDAGRDELHIATLYLVSQPGARRGSVPDGTWEPYHQSHVFWNVNHGNRALPVQQGESLRYAAPALAGGAASAIIATIVASLADAYDAAIEFVVNRGLEGRFWST